MTDHERIDVDVDQVDPEFQGTLLPGPAAALPDAGRKANAMTDGLKDVHRDAIIAAVAASDHVERAVLFGSRATGTNTVSSDVDIALFGDRLTLTDQARLATALEAAGPHPQLRRGVVRPPPTCNDRVRCCREQMADHVASRGRGIASRLRTPHASSLGRWLPVCRDTAD